ncbi:MAG: TetR/AcrR family transcriptional regulator [Myxococcales bacterium]|nr:TetR/AcrR family transcriptional regulator [Myxococcales bacterium]
MDKGDRTRETIVAHASDVASEIGLEGLSIGGLARDLEMSKSGLFAHFQSKEGLQIQVVEHAVACFVADVVQPALTTPRGVRRLRALLDRWMAWLQHGPFRGGCFFMAAAMEFDDRPGPVRDRIASAQRDWIEFLAGAARVGVETGDLRPDLDPRQLAFEVYGAMMAYQHHARLLDDPDAASRLRTAFDRLLADAARS